MVLWNEAIKRVREIREQLSWSYDSEMDIRTANVLTEITNALLDVETKMTREKMREDADWQLTRHEMPEGINEENEIQDCPF